jgi:hypothetical protein
MPNDQGLRIPHRQVRRWLGQKNEHALLLIFGICGRGLQDCTGQCGRPPEIACFMAAVSSDCCGHD